MGKLSLLDHGLLLFSSLTLLSSTLYTERLDTYLPEEIGKRSYELVAIAESCLE